MSKFGKLIDSQFPNYLSFIPNSNNEMLLHTPGYLIIQCTLIFFFKKKKSTWLIFSNFQENKLKCRVPSPSCLLCFFLMNLLYQNLKHLTQWRLIMMTVFNNNKKINIVLSWKKKTPQLKIRLRIMNEG